MFWVLNGFGYLVCMIWFVGDFVGYLVSGSLLGAGLNLSEVFLLPLYSLLNLHHIKQTSSANKGLSTRESEQHKMGIGLRSWDSQA